MARAALMKEPEAASARRAEPGTGGALGVDSDLGEHYSPRDSGEHEVPVGKAEMSGLERDLSSEKWTVLPYDPKTDESPPRRHKDDCTGEEGELEGEDGTS